MSQKMNPRPKEVKALSNYELEIEFSNGEIKIFSLMPYLNFGVFQELKDLNYFNRVKIENGTVTWPNEQDICPDTLYLEGQSPISSS